MPARGSNDPGGTQPQQAKAALGKAAENAALGYLESRGLVLSARNWAWRQGEIDLIMLAGTTLVFVEVRYRKNQSYGGAIESINHTKQARILKTAEHFLQSGKVPAYEECRFDVVAVTGDYPAFDLDWIRNAFQPGY